MENKKRLSIFIYSLGKGGAEKVASVLIKELQEYYKVHLVLLHDEISYELPSGVEKTVLNGGLISSVFKYKEFCQKNAIEVSLSLLTKPNLISLFSKLIGNKTKVIISEHTSQSQWRKDEKVYFYFKSLFISIFYNLADRIICVSKKISADLESDFHVKKNKLVTIYNPFDISKMKKKALEEVNDVEFDGKVTFISIGTLYHVKNYPLIIKAFYKLNIKNAQLLILGSGEDEEKLKTMVKKFGIENKVKFLGFQSNPFKYLSRSDIFVLGSNNEGLPNVLIEALACGCKVISTDCISGPREILSPKSDIDHQIKDDIEITKYGILTPVDNEELLVKSMKFFVEHKGFDTDSSSIKERVSEFDKESILKKYMDVIG